MVIYSRLQVGSWELLVVGRLVRVRRRMKKREREGRKKERKEKKIGKV